MILLNLIIRRNGFNVKQIQCETDSMWNRFNVKRIQMVSKDFGRLRYCAWTGRVRLPNWLGYYLGRRETLELALFPISSSTVSKVEEKHYTCLQKHSISWPTRKVGLGTLTSACRACLFQSPSSHLLLLQHKRSWSGFVSCCLKGLWGNPVLLKDYVQLPGDGHTSRGWIYDSKRGSRAFGSNYGFWTWETVRRNPGWRI